MRCLFVSVVVVFLGATTACAQSAADLAVLQEQVSQLESQGRYAEALAIAERCLTLARENYGKHHLEYGAAAAALASLYRQQGRYVEAEPLFKQALLISEKVQGPNNQSVATALNDLAALYGVQGRYAEAEPLYKRALVIAERLFGGHDPEVGVLLNNLGRLYYDQGRYADAEPLFKRDLGIIENALGPGHADVGGSLNNLAELYLAQGRPTEAEHLLKRALTVTEQALGTEHLSVSIRLSNLAALYSSQGRLAEAEVLYHRALKITGKALPPDHPQLGTTLNNLAELYRSSGRPDLAQPLYEQALSIAEKSFGPLHPHTGFSLNNLALLYANQGRDAEAESLYQRSLAVQEAALGSDHLEVSKTLDNLASLHLSQHNWAQAVDHWRRSSRLVVRRAARGFDDVGKAVTVKKKTEAEQRRNQFWGFIKAVHQARRDDDSGRASFAETFEAAQWVLGSEAAGSLAQMAARGIKGNAQLASIVRERQDIVEEWQRRDAVRTAAIAHLPERRDKLSEATNTKRLHALEVRISQIDAQLAIRFPDYASVARPTPLTVEEVQSQLRGDEALMLFLDTPELKPVAEETFIWVITKDHSRWVRSDYGTLALKRNIAAIRCGLDAVLWDDEATAGLCQDLLRAGPQRDVGASVRAETLPFDAGRAYGLYQSLFGQVEDLVGGKSLLIVPSGPLTQLPFQVLLTGPPSGEHYASYDWLAKRHAITVLPAVSSLKALRRQVKASQATKPMLGVGNPLLDGNPAERPWEAEWARLARAKQACPKAAQPFARLLAKRRDVRKISTVSGRAELAHLRAQMPLHDTADELCAVGRDLRISNEDILLGAKASEENLKRIDLTKYRILHFATHGTVAGEIEGAHEPGLILTPPKRQTDLDDGYLSASEVAGLKLDADWVILSACNTAAGGTEDAAALSGLARAFIYAGARALLVSHWSVDSAATVSLITHTVGALAKHASLGRSEALRRAMLAMVAVPERSHPVYWAPFVVVGEGAAQR